LWGGAETGLRVATAQPDLPSADPTPGNPILCEDLQTPALPTRNLVGTFNYYCNRYLAGFRDPNIDIHDYGNAMLP
jgi:hypothetical protein